MAKPAFIYAFDNLGPEKFTDLCGVLLGSRYKGFLLGGVGADGGIDSEIDNMFGEWHPEAMSPLINEIIQPGRLVVFQFKHKVVARVGQSACRTQILNYYKCQNNKKCELHSHLIIKRKPDAYVLVTNIEVNSEFRNRFIEQCKSENKEIGHYQIIGLDELESWITNEPELRHLYFPSIFGEPRFNLKIKLGSGMFFSKGRSDVPVEIETLVVSILNIGMVSSYIKNIRFEVIVDGRRDDFQLFNPHDPIMKMNPPLGTPIEPGRALSWNFPRAAVNALKQQGKNVFAVGIMVEDEIGHTYTTPIPEEFQKTWFQFV